MLLNLLFWLLLWSVFLHTAIPVEVLSLPYGEYIHAEYRLIISSAIIDCLSSIFLILDTKFIKFLMYRNKEAAFEDQVLLRRETSRRPRSV